MQLLYTYCPISQEVKVVKEVKFGHLIEYSMRKNFPEISHTKCGGETSPRQLETSHNWAYL